MAQLFTAKLLRMVFVGVLSGANEVGFYGTKSQYFFFVLICKHIQTHCVRAGIDTQVNSWLQTRAVSPSDRTIV